MKLSIVRKEIDKKFKEVGYKFDKISIIIWLGDGTPEGKNNIYLEVLVSSVEGDTIYSKYLEKMIDSEIEILRNIQLKVKKYFDKHYNRVEILETSV